MGRVSRQISAGHKPQVPQAHLCAGEGVLSSTFSVSYNFHAPREACHVTVLCVLKLQDGLSAGSANVTNRRQDIPWSVGAAPIDL